MYYDDPHYHPVGVIDSGVGGVSVLASLRRELWNENFVYYGDTAHAPYGTKTREEVLELTRNAVYKVRMKRAKAIVIACNTATSAAAATLREQWPDLPIIGVEPALKPAVLAHPQGRVLVMATELTLKLDKYQRLLKEWGSAAEVHEVACTGLMERIEREDLDAPDLRELLERLIGAYAGKVDAVVLGCTHYPFVARQISEVLGGPEIFDGAVGTARQLRARLEQEDLLASEYQLGGLTFLSSGTDEDDPARFRRFYGLVSGYNHSRNSA